MIPLPPRHTTQSPLYRQRYQDRVDALAPMPGSMPPNQQTQAAGGGQTVDPNGMLPGPPPAQSPWMPMGAQPAQYEQVNQFSDAAYEQARRQLDPLQEQQNRRMDQELINRGVDPNSPQGRNMMDQLGRQQTDQNSQATFGAMQFGQGVQNQMFGQNMAMGGLELGRQRQDFGELMGFANFDRSGRQYQDALTMALMGMVPVPGVTPSNTGGLAGVSGQEGWF